MKQFLHFSYPLLKLCLILILLFARAIIADVYTGHGVPVVRTTGLPAETFPIVSGGSVYSVLSDGSGGWFIGGNFTAVGSVTRNGLAHILADGSLDMSWVANITGTAVYAMDIVIGVGLVVGGSFTEINGTSRNNIAALSTSNGSVLSWYPSGGLNGIVYVVASRKFGGATLVGGNFTYGALSNLVDINSTASFVTSMGNPNGTVRALAVVPAGANQHCYVGGDFTEIFGTEANRICRISRDFEMGWHWTGWYPTGGANGTVRSLVIPGNTPEPPYPWLWVDVIAGGDFTTIGGVPRNHLAGLSYFDASIHEWDPNITGTSVFSLVSAGTKVYVGGNFIKVGDTWINNLAAISLTTGLVTESYWDPSPNSSVYSLALSTSHVYVGGAFEYMLTPPLPVEFNLFSARVISNSVELYWRTQTEVNNYGFDIERASFSTDATLIWQKIGFVSGYGNSNSAREYSFIDKKVLSGKYYYRLRQIDSDGKYKYSESIMVDLGVPKEFRLLQNYPNPFNPATTIRYEVAKETNVSLKVYDVIGNEVATLINETKPVGTYEVVFDAANLSNGVYFYQIQAGDFTATRKLTLMK